MTTAAAAPATTAAIAAWNGDGLSPPKRLAAAPLSTLDKGQLRLDDERRRDDDDAPLERFDELDPFVAPREREAWRLPLDFEEPFDFDEAPLFLRELVPEPERDRDELDERDAASSRSDFAPAPRWKRPVLSRGSSSSSSSPLASASSPESSSSSGWRS